MECTLTCHCYFTCYSRLCLLLVLYSTVVPPSLVQGSEIHQKSVFHCSVVGISVLYLTNAVRASCTVVVPLVVDNLTGLRKACHITGQKDSCAQSKRISSKVQFSSSIVSADTHLNSCYSCKLYIWYCTVTHQLPPFLSSTKC